MKNIQAAWPDSPTEQKVTSYNVYHNKPGQPPQPLYSTVQTTTIIYPDQLGYVEGDTVQISYAPVNATGEALLLRTEQVTLPEELDLPAQGASLVLTLVDG